MTDKEFEQLVAEGIDALPAQVREKMRNVAVVLADEPTPEQREEQELGEHDTLFGLYEGIPQTERDTHYFGVLPDKITIFKLPILDAYTDPDDIRACVANTVWHEVAHHFGYGDEWIEDQEEKRGKTL